MDTIKRDNSDSDLSDSWNLVESKEAPPIVSESESIEVLDYCDEEDDDHEDDDVGGDVEDIRETNNDTSEVRSIISSHLSLPGSRGDEVQLIQNEEGNIRQLYCVFPEEFHDVFTATDNVNTHELMCSISLIILCTIASSFMVITADNLMPSFLDVLVWQSLPDSQKDITISNPGYISQQLSVYKDRNEFLENKMNHLKLAVKAVEENMVSEAAFVEFVTDLQKSSFDDNSLSDKGSVTNDESVLSYFSSLPVFQHSKDLKKPKISAGYLVVEKSNEDNEDKNSNFQSGKESIEPKVIETEPTEIKNEDRKPINSARSNKNVGKLLSKLLTLFDVSSEPGLLLNKAALRLVNSKDKLNSFKNYNPNHEKLAKLNERVQNIENNIEIEVNQFFQKLGNKIFNAVSKFDQNLNNFICKNDKINTKFHDVCLENGKLRKNVKFDEHNTMKYEEQRDRYKKYKEGSRKDENYRKVHANKKNVFNSSEPLNTSGELKNKHKNKDVKYEHEKSFTSKMSNNEDSISLVDDKPTEEKAVNELKNDDHKRHNTINEIDYLNNQNNKKKYKEVKQTHKDKIEQRTNEHILNKHSENKINKKNNYKLKNEFNKFESKVKINNTNENQEKRQNNNDYKKKHEFENDKKQDKFLKTSKNNLNDFKKTNFKEKSTINSFLNPYEKENINVKNKKNNFETKKYSDNKSNIKNSKEYTKSKNFKQNDNKKFKPNERISMDDIKRFKEDVLNSIHNYIDELLSDFSKDDYNPDNNNNNSSYFTASNFLPGDWFLALGKKRSEIREEKKKSDWLFERAEGRHNLRDTNDDDERTWWFFRRAWYRNRIRF